MLAQHILAGSEDPEQLVVEIVTVGDDHEGGVLHVRVSDDFAGVIDHREALAAALGVPDHANAFIPKGLGLVIGTWFAGSVLSAECGEAAEQFIRIGVDAAGVEGAGQGFVDRPILVIGSVLFDQLALVLEDHKIEDVIQKTTTLEDALDQHLQFEVTFGLDLFAIDGTPGHEAIPTCTQAADARQHPIGCDHDLIRQEERRNLGFVGFELFEGAEGIGFFFSRVFKLQDGQGDAVDEHDHIGAAVVRAAVDGLNHGELVERQPVVVVEIVQIEQPQFLVGDTIAAAGFDLDIDALGQQAVESLVIDQQIGGGRRADFIDGAFDGCGGCLGIDASQGSPQPLGQQHLLVAFAFRVGSVRCQLRGKAGLVAERLQPVEDDLFEGVFGGSKH